VSSNVDVDSAKSLGSPIRRPLARKIIREEILAEAGISILENGISNLAHQRQHVVDIVHRESSFERVSGFVDNAEHMETVYRCAPTVSLAAK
jgi:hypothetical protein